MVLGALFPHFVAFHATPMSSHVYGINIAKHIHPPIWSLLFEYANIATYSLAT